MNIEIEMNKRRSYPNTEQIKVPIIVKQPIQPTTQELLNELRPYERKEAVDKYQEWVKKVRKQDRRQVANADHRLWRFKNKFNRTLLCRFLVTIYPNCSLHYYIDLKKGGEFGEHFTLYHKKL